MKFKKIIKNKFVWVGFVLLLVLISYISFSGNENSANYLKIESRDFIKKVSVVGTVKPAQNVDLGFEAGGRVASVVKKVGDTVYQGEIITSLSAGDILADLERAQADLNAEKARLAELTSLDENQNSKILTSKKELVQAIQIAYSNSDDAIRNHIDQFFKNGTKATPEIFFYFDDLDLRNEINKERKQIEYKLDRWNKLIIDLNVDNYTTEALEISEANLVQIRSFLNLVSTAVNSFDAGSGITVEEINTYKNAVSTARTQISDSITKLITAKENMRSVGSEIPYQQAKVQSAEAGVRNYEAALAKSTISAPFTGIITKQDAKVGESVVSGQALVSMISVNNFQIETYVPEINIKDVKIGDTAIVTLDAFGSKEEFEAKVIQIDPAETIKDGVATYKTLFEFSKNEERIKSGMTANVNITTEKKPNSILISPVSIIKKGDYSYVKVKVGNEIIEKQVTVGAFDQSGDVEILSGLSVGELVLKDPNQNK